MKRTLIAGALVALCIAILATDYAMADRQPFAARPAAEQKRVTAARLARKNRDNVAAWVLIAAVIRTARNQGYPHWTPILVVSSLVFAVAVVALLRKPFATPSIQALERELRRQRKDSPGLKSIEPAFPTPPLPKALTRAQPVGASKENARG